jgi:hypothetical protein
MAAKRGDQRPLPCWPQPTQEHPEEPVVSSEPRLRVSFPQNGELLAQGQVFKKQVPAGAQAASQESEEKSQRSGHSLL